LNSKNRIIKKELTVMGAADHCAISPGIVLRGAVASGEAGVIAIHNHPSGEPTPSTENRLHLEEHERDLQNFGD
jgi:DNA repair protein RadC